MPADQTPSSGQDGILWDGAMIPVSAPLSYIPCKGEPGIKAGNTFLPLEPLANIIHADDMPIVTTAVPIDRTAPWIDQVDTRVATPCIAPYDWSLAAADRTLILDTTPDASASAGEKALPGYVANPGLVLSSKTPNVASSQPDIQARNLTAGTSYEIKSIGTTDFTALGAASNTVGLSFEAHAVGAGTGYGMIYGSNKTSENLVVGQLYVVWVQGTSDFTLVGAANNNQGTIFTATGTTPGNGYAFRVDPAGSFVDGVRYYVYIVGTTDFTLVGSANNTQWTDFYASPTGGNGTGTVIGPLLSGDVEFIWTYGSSPATPHPALRAGQTRYAGISGAAVGTVAATGVPFLPGSGATLVNGTLKVSGYRYGMLLSDVPSYSVRVKIGRAKATWDKTAQTLTLETTETAGTTIKYTLDGGALTTYTTPISITDTGTVVWYAEKTNMVTSDSWSTYVEYADATPPDDFETIYFSALPAIGADQNTTVNVALQFQRKPDWYISPSGTGDGLTPSTPSNATDIIGLTTTVGKAWGPRWISATKSGTANMTLARGGGNPASSLMKYSEDGTTFTTYSTPITPAAPGRVWFKLVRADATDFTRRFSQPWFIGTGTGVQINAVWSLAGQTLTLTYEPTPLETADVAILYSLDGSAPSLIYTAPIVLVADCTPKVKAIHAAREPHDFATSTGVYDCSAIVIASTADYDEDHAATWTADATIPTNTHIQNSDIVWACEGTYTNPSGTATTYFNNRNYSTRSPTTSNYDNIIVRGGYSTDFTKRDVLGMKTIFAAASWSTGIGTNLASSDHVIRIAVDGGSGFASGGGWLDGVWCDVGAGLYRTTTSTTHYYPDNIAVGYTPVFQSQRLYNCHITGTLTPTCHTASVSVGASATLYHCTIDLSLVVPDGIDAVGTWVYQPFEQYAFMARNLAGTITCSPTGYFCTVDVSVSVGNAGAGSAGPTVTATSDAQARSTGSGGASSEPSGGSTSATASLGSFYYSTVVLDCHSGNGGAGGAGGDATGYNWGAISQGGPGGSSTCNASVGGYASTITIDASAGNGGVGGTPGALASSPWNTGYALISWGGMGGYSTCTATSSATSSNVTISSVAGSGGDTGQPHDGRMHPDNPGHPDPANYNTVWYYGSAVNTGNVEAVVGAAGGLWSAANLTALAGDGGDSYDQQPYLPDTYRVHGGYTKARVSATEGYGISLTGSATAGDVGANQPSTPQVPQGYLIFGTNPVYFESGDVTFTESDPYGAGNPVRVDHAAGSTTGWYSGMDNGNGAPLKSYETPRGTGVALGKFWE